MNMAAAGDDWGNTGSWGPIAGTDDYGTGGDGGVDWEGNGGGFGDAQLGAGDEK